MARCYRHPDRETNVSCSNCGRPICTDCMTVTPVGMRCPECARQRTKVVGVGSGLGGGDAPATYVLIGINVIVFLAEMLAGAGGGFAGSANGDLVVHGGLFGPAIDDGEYWRIITSGFLHASIGHLLLNMFALYFLGRLLEPAVGTPRFLALYFVSLLGGSLGALILDPLALTVGASGAVFGLMAAAFVIARHRGFEQIASQIAFFVVINVVFTFSVSRISVGGHIGGLIAGGLAALLIAFMERRRNRSVALELGLLAAFAVILVAGCLVAAAESVPQAL